MKRTLLATLFALPCLALPALAQDAKPKPTQPHLTWEQHFANANTAHDGRLTSEQAKTGYPNLFKHFKDIDPSGKGFVTKDDVKAWHKTQRTLHQPEPENKLRPRHTFQATTGAHPAVKASSQGAVPRGTATVGPDAPRTDGRPG